jgi:hypothetical protein
MGWVKMRSSTGLFLVVVFPLLLGMMTAQADWGRQVISLLPPNASINFTHENIGILGDQEIQTPTPEPEHNQGLLAMEYQMPKAQSPNGGLLGQEKPQTQTSGVEMTEWAQNELKQGKTVGLVRAWSPHGIGAGIPTGKNTTEDMSVDLWNQYYIWLIHQDTSKYTQYELGEYVCWNYTKDSLKAAYAAGYWHLYAAQIENYKGAGNHFAIAAHVAGDGLIYADPYGGPMIPNMNAWIIVDPQNDEILNYELINDGVTENITIIDPLAFYSMGWSNGGGVLSAWDPNSVVSQIYA